MGPSELLHVSRAAGANAGFRQLCERSCLRVGIPVFAGKAAYRLFWSTTEIKKKGLAEANPF